jgi:hypothetical protein
MAFTLTDGSVSWHLALPEKAKTKTNNQRQLFKWRLGISK